MTRELADKLAVLRQIIRDCQSALVAYSGGVDSALVAVIAHQELADRAMACIGVSPSYPIREQRDAIRLAMQLRFPHRLVNTLEHADPNYAANPANRCYFCKSELFSTLRAIASNEGWQEILDGTHLDDIGDHVNGMRAAAERSIRSPLLEARLAKHEVRELARELGLPAWDKPAMACLSSRVPHGTPITPQLLKQIESAEDVLADLGLRQFRVRHHGELARIELPLADFPRALDDREQILSGLRAAGYRYVTIDLAGFRDDNRTAQLVSLSIGARSG
jgi:uncharacterized protein